MTDEDFKQLSRILRDDSLSPETQWAIVSAVWLIALFVIVFVGLVAVTAHAQQTTIRDAQGRRVGTVTTDSAGTKTFRDGSGRTTGTATRDSGGTTTFRDSQGRTTGTAFGPRH
jgi:hypothetical protein